MVGGGGGLNVIIWTLLPDQTFLYVQSEISALIIMILFHCRWL